VATRDIMVRLILNSDGAVAGLNRFSKGSDVSVKSMAKMAIGAIGVGAAVSGLTRFLGDASQAAMEDSKSQALLHSTMQKTVGASQDQIAAMEEWIDKTSRAVGVADDELRPALNNLFIAGMDAAGAQEALGLALDISAAKGLSLESVAKAMAKAYQGNMGSLSRLGIQIKDTDGRVLSFDEAMEGAAETMGGAATVAASTLSGEMAKMQVQADEAKEKIGNLVNVGLVNLISGVEFLDASMAGATKGNELFVIGIEDVRSELVDATSDVNALAGGLVFAANHAVAPTTDAFMEQVRALKLTKDETDLLATKVDELADRNLIGRDVADQYIEALDGGLVPTLANVREGHGFAETATEKHTKAQDRQERQANRLEKQLGKLADAINDVRDEQLNAEDATLGWEESLDDLRGTLKENGVSLDKHTQKGRDNRSAVADAVSAALDFADAMIAQDKPIATIRARLDEQRSALEKVMSQAGFTKDEIQKYLDKLGLIPSEITTAITAHATITVPTITYRGSGASMIPEKSGVRTLARGGVVTDDALAMLHGAGGGEAVIPLNQVGARFMADTMAEALQRAGLAGGKTTPGVTVNASFYGTSEQMIRDLDRRIGLTLRMAS